MVPRRPDQPQSAAEHVVLTIFSVVMFLWICVLPVIGLLHVIGLLP